jgi:hypothetical protein
MYMVVKRVIGQRKKMEQRDTDPVQHCLDQGIPDGTMVKVRTTNLPQSSSVAHGLYLVYAGRALRGR